MHTLSADEVFAIHDRLVSLFAGSPDPISPPGPRDRGLVESAASRPLTSLGGTKKYQTVNAAAAAFFHSLVKNHAFFNGNKRTALVSLIIMLERNDCTVTVSDDDLFDFVIAVAEDKLGSQSTSRDSDLAVDAIQRWIKSHTSSRTTSLPGMRVSEFIKAIEKAGGRVRESDSSWLIQGNGFKSIKISQSTTSLNGIVVKRYLQKLGLSEGQTGIHFEEFQEGLDPDQQLMRRYRAVLDRLAHS